MQNIPTQIIKCLLDISDCHAQVLFQLKKLGYNICIDWINKRKLIDYITKHKIIYNKMKYEDINRLPLIYSIPKMEFENIVIHNNSFCAIRKELKNKYKIAVEQNTILDRINRDNIYYFNLYKKRSFSDEEFIKIVKESDTYIEINKKLGINGHKNYTVKNRIVRLNIDVTHLKTSGSRESKNKKSLEDILKKGTKIKSSELKKRLIKERMLEDKCIDCGITNEWNGKPLTLQLDHINGDHNDNRFDNLAIRCPNCHTQTENYGNKNKAYQKDGYRDKHKLHKLEPKKEYKCIDCNIEIYSGSDRCRECYKKHNRIVERPSYDQLKQEIEQLGYVGTGKKYGLTDNAVRKWLKNYEKDNTNKNMSDDLNES
ncbi:HNH endonuclease [Fadolivirus algeromassiliense]|jgi:Zn finger protein HypA/HybF involved in hydrogenase expression|uniref:HNH endonuclease n=1 Tax=Fadolivirus FV1/VV64 TaxID=3070911 RepID=A0A7D3UVC8_9VIRU|nr:HNH endonuclease [Fadolivirus algeromassiliense]QKF94089.1 HNH endonuclease [Fadolivirus FV1/VV64]